MRRGDVPGLWKNLMNVLKVCQPVLKYAMPALRSTETAAVDLIKLAIGKEYAGTRGYYEVSSPSESSPESRDEKKQKEIWLKSLSWIGLKEGDTALKTAF
jgi:hypothetical protein